MNSRSGLSLFELLVALALLAMIATGLAGALGLAVSVWDRSATISASAEEIALRSRLRIWTRQAIPPSRLTPIPAQFVGHTDGFSFFTLSETPFAPDAAALRVSVTTSGTQILMTAQSIDDEGAEVSRVEGILATGISPRLSYYSDTASPPGWQDTWEDTSRLPTLVRIEAPDGSAPDWPDFVVRLRLD
ncbi:prepilin-type N-terminal cleavage/methylation domain-containing protein [Sulfitobacter sp. HNIBRBA2951]|uniref:prepilin-type N-terminal cleavage/methylation domain-containing protein n=1 Tax=Sulfitobacter aquimarinus TaxID=3158557 RepID=UPI0032E02342